MYAYEKRKWDFTVAAELFAEIYNMFQDEIPKAETLRETLYWYVSDYSDEMAAYRVRESFRPFSLIRQRYHYGRGPQRREVPLSVRRVYFR